MDSTSPNTRRSSSRASRKSTQEPESNLYRRSRTAYSLPTTPIISSFEDVPSSTRRLSLSYNEKPQDPKAFTGSSGPKTLTDLSDMPSGVPKKSRRHQPDTVNGDTVSTTASDISRAPTPTSSSSHMRPHAQPEESQSTLPKDSSDSAVIPTPRSVLTDSARSGSEANESTATASPRRRSRNSMPARTSAARSRTSTPRSNTPQPSRRDWEPKAGSRQDEGLSTTPRPKPPSTPATTSVSRLARTNAMERAKLATPAEQTSQSTPNNRSSARTRRRKRGSISTVTSACTDKTKETPQPTTISDEDTDGQKSEPASKDGSEVDPTNKPRKSNTITLTLSRKALESVLSKSKPMEHLHYSPEIADSVEATPVHLYDNSFHFDYDSDMYRNNFGLDGQIDAPASPTSFSTTTSTAARTSNRTRKPTIRALESFQSQKRFRRNRTRTPRPSGEGTQAPSSSEPKTIHPPGTAADQPVPVPQEAPQPDVTDLARRLLAMASAAVLPDSAPDATAELWLRELWEKHRAAKRKDGNAGTGGESQFNEFGEELLGIPDGYTWVRPNNTYGDDALPQPPMRLKSCEQIERDKIFGFPPRIGERNLPREVDSPFVVEDVDGERAKIKLREQARMRGITTDRSMSLSQIEALIAQHDSPGAVNRKGDRKDGKPKKTRKRRRGDPVVQENLGNPILETPDDSRPKRRRKDIGGSSVPTPVAQSTPTSKSKPTPRSRRGRKSRKESQVGADTPKSQDSKPSTETPKTREPKTGSENKKTRENKPAAETPKERLNKQVTPKAQAKEAQHGPAPSSQVADSMTANSTEALKKRRRRRKKPPVILRIIGPKKEDENRGDEHAPKESKKRSHSEVDGGDEERGPKSPRLDEPMPWPRKIKLKKPSPEKNRQRLDEGISNGTIPYPRGTPSATRDNPSTVESHDTPSGRPRRAAAAAMIEGSKHDAEERARKSRRRSRKSHAKEMDASIRSDPGKAPEPTRIE